jgi:hypothetical protein
MKFIRLFAVLTALASIMVVQSCKDEDEPAPGASPTVTLDITSTQDIPGAEVTVTVSIVAPNGGKTLFISGVDNPDVDLAGETEIEEQITIEIPNDAVIGSEIVAVFTAVDNKNQSSEPVEFTITVGDPVAALQGNLTTQTLDAGTVYLLKGQVFVPNGVTLTIPAGTVIKGERSSKGTLIVRPGGKLVCNGTAANPVVFTSDQDINERDRGDWGGVILLGNAFVNQSSQPAIEGIEPAVAYGNTTSPATNADDDSGVLNYVRIEFAGIELTPNNETNSLTMGGVGNGTDIDYVQISYGGDDGFEWFGGTVNCKHIISFSTWDDDFDTDFGWSGNVQFALGIRYPFMADQSGSNAFESDNQANANAIAGKCDGTTTDGCTRGIFANVTILGPRDFNAGLIRSGETATTRARAISGNFQNAIHIRRRSALSIFNSYFAGFPTGIRIDDQATLDNLNNGAGKIMHNVFMVPSTTVNGTSSTANNVVYATNIGTGDAAVVNTYINTGLSNTVSNPANATTAAWSPTQDQPSAGAANPYPAVGISSSLFWGNNLTTENPAPIDQYPTNPNFAVTSGTLSSNAGWSDPKVSGVSFFDQVTYRGAFGATDWTDTWAEFRPMTKAY